MIDNDTKKSTGKQDGNQGGNVSTSFPTHFQPPTSRKSGGNVLAGYQTTEQVANIIGVTRKAVEYWRKRGWFNADLVDHNGVYWYLEERVEQLKAIVAIGKRHGVAARHKAQKNLCPKFLRKQKNA